MRSSLLPLLMVFLGLAACAGQGLPRLPELAPGGDRDQERRCAGIFPRGDWQLTHSIEFSLRGGHGSTVIGVTRLSGEEIGCALMTVEGFTLFAALYRPEEGIVVERAVPPFDAPSFAGGLLADVRLIFTAPEAAGLSTGTLPDGTPVCRYDGAGGGTLDLLAGTGGCWQLKSYDQEGLLARAVTARSCRPIGGAMIPASLELQRFGPAGYTLRMNLLAAEKTRG